MSAKDHDANPNGKTAIQSSCRETDSLGIAVDTLEEHLVELCQLVLTQSIWLETESEYRELWCRHHFNSWNVLQLAGGPVGQIELFIEVVSEGIETERLDRQPRRPRKSRESSGEIWQMSAR